MLRAGLTMAGDERLARGRHLELRPDAGDNRRTVAPNGGGRDRGSASLRGHRSRRQVVRPGQVRCLDVARSANGRGRIGPCTASRCDLPRMDPRETRHSSVATSGVLSGGVLSLESPLWGSSRLYLCRFAGQGCCSRRKNDPVRWWRVHSDRDGLPAARPTRGRSMTSPGPYWNHFPPAHGKGSAAQSGRGSRSGKRGVDGEHWVRRCRWRGDDAANGFVRATWESRDCGSTLRCSARPPGAFDKRGTKSGSFPRMVRTRPGTIRFRHGESSGSDPLGRSSGQWTSHCIDDGDRLPGWLVSRLRRPRPVSAPMARHEVVERQRIPRSRAPVARFRGRASSSSAGA